MEKELSIACLGLRQQDQDAVFLSKGRNSYRMETDELEEIHGGNGLSS